MLSSVKSFYMIFFKGRIGHKGQQLLHKLIKICGYRNNNKSGVTIIMEHNFGEAEQELYRCFRTDNGPLTIQLFLKARH